MNLKLTISDFSIITLACIFLFVLTGNIKAMLMIIFIILKL
jgi:hypothetical protein